MRKKTGEELERAKLAKATRTLVRLKHSLAADEELNSILPDTLAEFDVALSSGQVRHIPVGQALDDIIGG